MKLVIDHDRCTGCKTCVRVCPQMILEVHTKKLSVTDESRCMGCFGCEEECRENAITVLKASHLDETIDVEAAPEHDDSCDVVVVGAGPAGLGAAIWCARSGLDVLVCERLPNRKRSHHPDGGVLVSLPGLTSIQVKGRYLQFPQLGVRLPRELARNRVERIGLRGPKGLRAGERVPPDVARGIACGKDRFVESLIAEAEVSGAKIRFGARVEGLLRDKRGRFTGVSLGDGETIGAKVVVCADGVTGKMSQQAGLPNNTQIEGRGEILELEYENEAGLPPALIYFFGDLDVYEGTPPAMAGVAISDRVHVMFGLLGKKRFHPGKRPLDDYLHRLLGRDPRAREILGDSLEGREPVMYNGCRVLFRQTNRDIVRDGLVSVGDAFIAGGELGNIPALAAGIHTGKVIEDAAWRRDFSAASLAPSADFITPRLESFTKMNGGMKLLPTKLSEKEMFTLFEIMQHMNMPTVMFGTPKQQSKMFQSLLRKSFLSILRNPGLIRKLIA